MNEREIKSFKDNQLCFFYENFAVKLLNIRSSIT